MDPTVFWDLASRVGLPFAMVVLALLGGRTGIWVWGREIEYERKQLTARLAEVEAEKAELRADRDYYRTRLFDAMAKAEGAVSNAEQAVDLAERRAPRRRP